MNSKHLVFSVVVSLAAFTFQSSALADANDDKGRRLIQEAAELTKQAADLTKEENPENSEKVQSLLKEAGDKLDEAREAAAHSVNLTDEQKKGLVVGYGDRDGDGAHDPEHQSNLAEQTQNPVASLISVPLESNFNFGVGEADNFQYVMNAKPVIPMKLTDDWTWIHRGIQPLIAQDNLTNTGTDIETDSSIISC